MDQLAIFAARYLIILAPLVLLQIMWTLPPRDRVRFMILTIFSLGLAYVLAKVGSQIYENPRPFIVGQFVPLVPHGVDNGFPSLHTLVAATIAFVALSKSRLLGGVLVVMALIIGAARVYAGVHHAVDIFGGFVVAATAVGLAHILLRIRVRR